MLTFGATQLLRLPFGVSRLCASPGKALLPLAAHRRSSSAPDSAGWYAQAAHSAPVRMAEDFLTEVQQSGALPWWLAIGATTLGIRTLVTLPLAAYQIRILAKVVAKSRHRPESSLLTVPCKQVEALQPEIAALAQRLRYEVSARAGERGWTDAQCRFHFRKNLRRLVSELHVRDNCHPFKASLLLWVQLPLWISLSLALRNLSQRHSELQASLTTGGALWFPDLTMPDSTWLLPLALGLTNLLIVELFARQRTNVTSVQKWVSHAMRGLSLLMIPIAASVPSSMALYWLCSSLVGLSHNLLLKTPVVREALGLPARHKTPSDVAGKKLG
ncbi:cytochrome c oxidase assembly protein COX18, mitochondrial isoform X1 [Stigmatopora nigra]